MSASEHFRAITAKVEPAKTVNNGSPHCWRAPLLSLWNRVVTPLRSVFPFGSKFI